VSDSARYAAELLSARSVLCVQPHYDDNDIAAAGTFAALADAGVLVHYMTVSDDLKGVLDANQIDADATRQLDAEQLEAGRLIGVASQCLLNLPDAGDWDVVALRTRIIERIRALRPDYVFTCDPRLENEMHRDHLRTGIAVGEAVMFYGMKRFETTPEVDSAYEPHAVRGLVLYFTREPNLVFDVTGTRGRKHEALDCYRAQFSEEALRSLHRGMERMEGRWATDEPFDYGEAFKLL
jgi:LmbE family N-acetylglucosaminyl deacetylase